MARILIPEGYSSWNDYINQQADASPDQSIEARRLIKRDIKLSMIAMPDRNSAANISSMRYEGRNSYVSPGTVSPTVGHPWVGQQAQMLMENGIDWLGTENNDILIVGKKR